ncbi:histidine kinase [Pseudoalteromonas aliena]|uniref:sensor histidine kinase n=1 Tax=Pseudoalteromonas aliena TaxID=247523 RepID=UPI00311D37F1
MNILKKHHTQNTQANTLFWMIQITGWGLFTLLNLATRQYFVYFHFSELINSVVLGLCLLITTSALRKYYQYNLVNKSGLSGLVHILLGSVVAGFSAIFLYALIIVPNQAYIFQTVTPDLWQQILYSSPVIMLLLLVWSVIYAIVKKQQLLKQTHNDKVTLEQSLKTAKLDILLSQINPHFIFNAINNIRALILEDSDRARDMLAHLSEVMRYTMQIDKEKLIPLSNELEVVKQYIALNKLQFEDKLEVEYKLNPETLELAVPPMILQLLIENAVKHGIGKLKSGGTIIISSQIVGTYWLLSVENSGVLSPVNTKNSTSVGLNNIKQRLLLVFAEKSSFTLSSSKLGVLAKIKLPLQKIKHTTSYLK